MPGMAIKNWLVNENGVAIGVIRVGFMAEMVGVMSAPYIRAAIEFLKQTLL